jgi:hypothetical protein
MSELQNNTVIVLPTYFTLNEKGKNGLHMVDIGMSGFVPRGYGVS